MDEFWRGSLVCLFIYGNYMLFSSHIKTIFWSLCYSVLSQEIRKNNYRIFHSVFIFLFLFPVLSATLLPSVVLLFCGREVAEYASKMVEIINASPSLFATVKKIFLSAMLQVCKYLDIHKNDTLSDSFVLYKIYLKLEEMKNAILSGSQEALSWAGHFAFFLGFSAYFSQLERNPLSYVLKPIPRCAEIVSLFEKIIHTLAVGSIFNFTFSFILSLYFGSTLIMTNGVLSAFLSVFPVFPLCLYCIPTVIHLWLSRRVVAAVLFAVLAVVQQIASGRMFKFPRSAGYLQSASIALGLKVFGLPGAILGPFLLFSLLILWSVGRPAESQPVKSISKSSKPKQMTKAMEILRKTK
ncbi:hypothetical protein NEMIN01_0475 [Nematocida minor]|uniref:uncharacterized protein n=1 Tax=Nematocida minor TaxID=1912983 RepID=UPI00221FD23B|nr:uncharacterized protein NEMIN01_0475 [Nematocida minor]KAI5189412.1 hypothetical protein NEMIN01_0475 [Nematocida minor]